jgi:para-aminobenzoate synthetase/4-amino-4-deoxychorismate lyase
MPGVTEPRLVRRPLSWQLSREAVLRLVRSDSHPVALFGDWAGGADIVAAEPVTVRSAPWSPDQVFDSGLPAVADQRADGTGPAFGGGWIGYLGYSAAGEALPASGPRALPLWWFGYYDHVLRRDRATGEWFFEALWTAGRAGAIEARLAELDRRAAAAADMDSETGEGCEFGPFRLVPGADGHIDAVRAAVEYIRQGDIFQANVTLRAQAEYDGDPLDAFCRGVAALDPPYAAFVSISARAGGPALAGGAPAPVGGPAPAGGGPLPGGGGPLLAGGPVPAGRAAVASLSPELFLRREAETVASKPIKGTARRDAGVDEAAAQRASLEASAKNRAENVMIVDLVRADLSRVCVAGSVTVPVLLGPEPHPGVWHLVSTVTGKLHEGTTDGDLIRATFPPGSVTGAPKVRALEIIDELEAAPREVYTGAIGYRSPAAGLELNVAIRTFEFAPSRSGAPGQVWLGAGGGIVADSDPAAEYAECLIKATPLLTALGARLHTDGTAAPADAAQDNAVRDAAMPPRPHPTAGVVGPDDRTVPRPYPAAPPRPALSPPHPAAGVVGPDDRAVLRPDRAAPPYPAVSPHPAAGVFSPDDPAVLRPHPAAGIFSSLTVTAGVTRGLDAHLARLAASVRALYGKDLPVSLRDDLARCLDGCPTGRLRISVRPVGGPLQATVEVVPLTAQPAAVALRPVSVAGGIGGHKYRDRRLLTALAAGAAPDEQVLLTDETGELLETDRANVFAVIDGVLLTPPADGRLLPGTTRAAVLRAAHAIGVRTGQKPLTLDELAEASEVFVTNAVVGVLPVRAVAGVRRAWPAGPVTAALAASLVARPADGPGTLAAPPPGQPAPAGQPALAAQAAPAVHASAPPAPAAPLAAVGLQDRPAPRIPWRTMAGGPDRPLVVLLDNYDSFTGNLAHLLQIAGARVEVIRNDEVTAAAIIDGGPAGVVISPGPCAPAEAGISIATVTACALAGVPLLGICLGHQAIGAAFGARIVRAPVPVHGKAFPVSHDGRGVLAGLPELFQATRYHSLIIDESTLPIDLTVTARTESLPMGVRHRHLPIEGVQFHPESILTTHGAAIIGNFTALARKARPTL